MFSVLPTPARTYPPLYHYTPVVSSPLSSSPLPYSPLSSRDANGLQRVGHNNPTMSSTPTPSKLFKASPNATSSTSPASSRESVFSKRITKVNPLVHGRNGNAGSDGRETRRKLFLKRVREDAEDKKWKARGGDDEMMRSIWIAEQRRREDRQRREAMGLDILPGEEEESLSLDEIMADEVALKEEAELEALLASMEEAEMTQNLHAGFKIPTPRGDEIESLSWLMDGQVPIPPAPQYQPPQETPYGSDDEEYDHIFMDVILQESKMATQSVLSEPPHAVADQEMMDMT